MLVSVKVTLDDGLELDIAQEVEDGADVSPDDVLRLAARDGYLSLSDSERVSLDHVAGVAFVEEHAQGGPGWGPGLQDEDDAAAAASSYDAPQRP